MEKIIVILAVMQLLSYLAMVAGLVFNKDRLVKLSLGACITFGGLAIILGVIKQLIIM